jgi:hypothetical protein
MGGEHVSDSAHVRRTLVDAFSHSPSIIDCWTVLQNYTLATASNTSVFLANACPARYFVARPDLTEDERADDQKMWEESARVWGTRIGPETRHILFPTNVRGTHWVLLIVSLDDAKVVYWDSLRKATTFPTSISKAALTAYLCVMLNELAVREWTFVAEAVPQQTGANCGAFVIEFMRAFVGGHRKGKSLKGVVSENRMEEQRQRITSELKVLEQ